MGTAVHSAGLAQEEVVQGHAQRVEVGHELVHGWREAEALAESLGDVEQGPGSLGHLRQGRGCTLHECRAHAIAKAGCRLQTCRINTPPVSMQYRKGQTILTKLGMRLGITGRQAGKAFREKPVNSPWPLKAIDAEG